METPEPQQAVVPAPLSPEDTQRRQELEDSYEDLVLTVLASEAEWLLDDRIAYAVRQDQRKAA